MFSDLQEISNSWGQSKANIWADDIRIEVTT